MEGRTERSKGVHKERPRLRKRKRGKTEMGRKGGGRKHRNGKRD